MNSNKIRQVCYSQVTSFAFRVGRSLRSNWRFSLRIRMAREDGGGAVELLGEHGAGKFVREGQRRKRKLLRSAAAQRLRKTLRAAAQECDFARSTVTRFTEPPCGLRRRLRLF